jgi:hypothetical protein
VLSHSVGNGDMTSCDSDGHIYILNLHGI